jgi:probable rRNA maturation factor
MKPVRSAVDISIFHAYKSLSAPKSRLKSLARKIFDNEKVPKQRTIHLILCSNAYIKKLNATFRDKPQPTDVLSFNYDEEDFLGEIYISLQRAKTQAKQYKVTYFNEIERLFIHGMFHLLGFDHEKTKDRLIMEAKEKKYRQ